MENRETPKKVAIDVSKLGCAADQSYGRWRGNQSENAALKATRLGRVLHWLGDQLLRLVNKSMKK